MFFQKKQYELFMDLFFHGLKFNKNKAGKWPRKKCWIRLYSFFSKKTCIAFSRA
eukprot:UN00242